MLYLHKFAKSRDIFSGNRHGESRKGERGMWQKLTKDTLIFDWSKFHPGAALLCVPAIAAALAIGLSTGHARQG